MIYGYETLTLIPATGSPVTVSVASQDLYQPKSEHSARGDGSEGLDSREHVLEALVVDAAALATVEAWERSGTLVRAFAAGLEASLVWDEPCRMRALPEAPAKSGRHARRVRLFSALRDAAIEGPRVNLIGGRFAPAAMPWGATYQNEDAIFEMMSGIVTVGGEEGAVVTASVDVVASAARLGSELRLWLEGLSAAGALLYQTSEVIASEGEGTRTGIVSVSAPVATVGNRVRWRVDSTDGLLSDSDVLRYASVRIATPIMATTAATPVPY